jgi:hypothetical protein
MMVENYSSFINLSECDQLLETINPKVASHLVYHHKDADYLPQFGWFSIQLAWLLLSISDHIIVSVQGFHDYVKAKNGSSWYKEIKPIFEHVFSRSPYRSTVVNITSFLAHNIFKRDAIVYKDWKSLLEEPDAQGNHAQFIEVNLYNQLSDIRAQSNEDLPHEVNAKTAPEEYAYL